MQHSAHQEALTTSKTSKANAWHSKQTVGKQTCLKKSQLPTLKIAKISTTTTTTKREKKNTNHPIQAVGKMKKWKKHPNKQTGWGMTNWECKIDPTKWHETKTTTKIEDASKFWRSLLGEWLTLRRSRRVKRAADIHTMLTEIQPTLLHLRLLQQDASF